MTRGKKLRSSTALRKAREEEDKSKFSSSLKPIEEKVLNKANTIFKTEEIQEICSLLNLEEVGDQHCFLGAVVISRFDVVKRLLKEGHNIDSLDENRETALMHAVKGLRHEMVSFLVNRSADIALMDSHGNTAIMLAAQSNLWDQDSFSGLWTSVRNNTKFKIDQANKAGYRLLHYVVKRQWQAVLEMLLSAPVSVDVATNKGVTALIMAASRGDQVMVSALLNAGADFSIEDQEKCTALCYAISFSLQKNVTKSNQALERLLAAVNDESSKLTLEQYLKRRLELICCPPRAQNNFSKTINKVIVHVLTFFARFIHSGFELLLELSVFLKLKEGLEKHGEDVAYVLAVLNVVSQLVKYCSCCCQGLTQDELADTFFAAGLGGTCLDLLDRYGSSKTTVTKAVFIPLTYVCSSGSYSARTWLETHFKSLETYYNKYMRSSFPSVLVDTNNDVHLEIEKKCSLAFQNIMKTLKSKGQIVSDEEHSKAATKLKEQNTLSSVYTILNQTTTKDSSWVTNDKKLNITPVKRKKSKPSTIYNSIIQYNFGKLDIIQGDRVVEEKAKPSTSSKSSVPHTSPPPTEEKQETKPEKAKTRERKSRIAIKEIQVENSKAKTSILSKVESDISLKSSNSSKDSALHEAKKLEPPKRKFAEGYQLFKMEEEALNSDEDSFAKQVCDWLDSSPSKNESKVVSDEEVAETLKQLKEIFNRIVNIYRSTWKKQRKEGYLGAKGSDEDLRKLVSVLPALENFHMERLINKWEKFCKQIKEHARKNYLVYGAMVSEMQLFLLEFEGDLEKRNVKVDKEDDESSVESYLDTQEVLRQPTFVDVNVLSDGKPVEYLINKRGLVKIGVNRNTSYAELDIESGMINPRKIVDFLIENDGFEDNLKSDLNDCSENCIWNVTPVNPAAESKSNPDAESKSNPDAESKSNCIPNIATLTKEQISEVMNQINKSADDETKVTEGKEELTGSNLQNKDETNLVQKIIDELKEIESHIPQPDVSSSDVKSKINPPGSKSEITILTSKNEKEYLFSGKNDVKSKNEVDDNSKLSTEKTEVPKIKFELSELDFSGLQYVALCVDLENLPSCKTQLLDKGNIQIASQDFQLEFKLFNGFNFGDVYIGLSCKGMPLAVRKVDKLGSATNHAVRTSLLSAVTAMLPLRHPHILPYLAGCETSQAVVVVQPLCCQDMGQYVRKVRLDNVCHLNAKPSVTAHLVNLVHQMIAGLHYLHTRETPIIHGNLKPSNVLIDNSGCVRLSEFGLHKSIFRHKVPLISSTIWWSRDSIIPYYRTWKYVCNLQSDIQSAGMIVHFMLTFGQHAYGQELSDIMINIQNGTVYNQLRDSVASDLVYWMLSHDGTKRPTTQDVLRHVTFWSKEKRWQFLTTCCGKGMDSTAVTKMYRDLDFLANLNNINTKWISLMKKNFDTLGDNFTDNPSSFLHFLGENIETWSEIKDDLLNVFAILPLNLYRMIEQTVWIDHEQFKPFTEIDTLD